ncbi:MAG TPA: EI24 domain-containing protein [Rhodopila sp.]|uniref:EI24 domain-containing protein n=1 Tax=Rhodopila sp. TaxID=2480087 RepID=UPI002BA81814|nr:EI24 domain-containing protein [Rhodopila sp.]HVY17402.1 EI24 domain-containing protein [Rhodopila sp.]
MNPFQPVARALSQTNDPVFIGVLWRSVAWSVACFAALHVLAIWGVHQLALPAWAAWLGDILGTVGASLLAMWLFLPVAAAIGMLYFERISRAVEARFYPHLPPPEGASLSIQAWDGVVVALKVLALNVVALVLALLLPGIGWLLGWIIAAYAIGRGLFVAVAMRRMPRPVAESVYGRNRSPVLAVGAILALAAYVPLVNLLIPIIGTAAMVHLMDQIITETVPPRAAAF